MSRIADTFSNLVSQASQAKRAAQTAFKEAARNGDINVMDQYCRAHKGRKYLPGELNSILYDVINTPKLYKNPRDVVGFIEKRFFDFESFFADFPATDNFPAIALLSIYSMYPQDPRPETAETAAVFLAEFLKIRIAQERYDYNFAYEELADFIKTNSDVFGIEDVSDENYVRDSILTVQNALVDYVTAQSGTLPLNRGAAFLSIVTEDVPADVSRIWTNKVTDVKVSTDYHPVNGDVTVVRPVFEP